MKDMKSAVTHAVIKMLRPLVRILMKNNIPYGTFCEIAKWVYVDVASKAFAIPGRKQTISRIAVITGLSRKEASRVRDLPVHDELASADRTHRAVRVINGWLTDPDFLDAVGRPKTLPTEGTPDSFASLVKKYSGDIPHRAVLDEMKRAGVVESADGNIKLISEGYVVSGDEIEKINIFGTDSAEFISTIAHNIAGNSNHPFFQRKVSYDNIPENALPELQGTLNEIARKYIKSIDKLMSKYDRDTNPSVPGNGRRTAGLGIYYFEK